MVAWLNLHVIVDISKNERNIFRLIIFMNFFHLIILVISKMPGPGGAVPVPVPVPVVLTINYVFKIINIIWPGWSGRAGRTHKYLQPSLNIG